MVTILLPYRAQNCAVLIQDIWKCIVYISENLTSEHFKRFASKKAAMGLNPSPINITTKYTNISESPFLDSHFCVRIKTNVSTITSFTSKGNI